jgi:hypothetical protein
MRLEKMPLSIAKPTSILVDDNQTNSTLRPTVNDSSTKFPTRKDRMSEYQSVYKPIVNQKKPRTRKAFEAEQALERVKYFRLSNIVHVNSMSMNRNEVKSSMLNELRPMTKAQQIMLI